MSLLSIGTLSTRTGVSPATLRMWEQRHGFPTPVRLESGHRRYRESDVGTVVRVVERQQAGVRLDTAITQVLADEQQASDPGSPSVYAALRKGHPALHPHRLTKATLLALSWAIEDEFCARADRPHLFGAFQQGRYFAPSRSRWNELSRVARSTFVLGQFEAPVENSGPIQVPLPADAPMCREWAVVCDSRDLPIVLTAWELPGQEQVRDRDRMFESIWTLDPTAVRDAARVCAQVSLAAGVEEARPVLADLAGDPRSGATDLATATSMFTRMVAYVDRFGAPSR